MLTTYKGYIPSKTETKTVIQMSTVSFRRQKDWGCGLGSQTTENCDNSFEDWTAANSFNDNATETHNPGFHKVERLQFSIATFTQFRHDLDS